MRVRLTVAALVALICAGIAATVAAEDLGKETGPGAEGGGLPDAEGTQSGPLAVSQDETAPIKRKDMWPRGIVYVQFRAIDSGAYKSLAEWLSEGNGAALQGIIFDLRGAAGADLIELQKIASMFLPANTPICRILTRDGDYRESVRAIGGPMLLKSVSTVMIVDDKTSGMAEILAGALSGRRDVIVMGRSTSGQASVGLNGAAMGVERGAAEAWADWGQGIHKPLIPDIVVDPAKEQKLFTPSSAGREAPELIKLLEVTAADVHSRRATDLILAQIRIKQRKTDAGESPEPER